MRAPSRRLAIAAVIGATAFTATGAFAASLTLTNDTVGAADAAIVSPCTAARADYTPFYNNARLWHLLEPELRRHDLVVQRGFRIEPEVWPARVAGDMVHAGRVPA